MHLRSGLSDQRTKISGRLVVGFYYFYAQFYTSYNKRDCFLKICFLLKNDIIKKENIVLNDFN